MKIRFPKPKVAEYNSLFKIVANNEELSVKRSNKNVGHGVESPVRQWQDAEVVQLRAGASREENLLVSGRLAHPAPAISSQAVYRAIQQAGLQMSVDEGFLQRLLGAAEYARGAKVSDEHYSNPKISHSATSIIADAPESMVLTIKEKVAENVALRLLRAPVKWLLQEDLQPTSDITPITAEETLDENIKGFYERFLLQAIPLVLQGQDREVSKRPTGGCEGGGSTPPTDKAPDKAPAKAPDEGKGEPQEKPEAEAKESPEAKGEAKADRKADEAKAKLEELISEAADALSTGVEANAKAKFEKRQQQTNAGESLVPDEQTFHCSPEDLDQIGVPETFNPEQMTGRLTEWVEPKFKLSSISPIEDDGQSIKSFTGLPTNEIWKLSTLGNVNVFDSTSSSGSAASLLVLADLSGSTCDKGISTPFGVGNTQDVIWALSGKMLELSVNSRSYGFYQTNRWNSWRQGDTGATMGIVEGQKAGLVPSENLGGGGTPTAEVLAWAADKSESSDEVIVLITDGLPDHKAPAMVRRVTDNGSRVAVVVVPNSYRYGSDIDHCLKVARSFGGEMSAVCDVRNPKSIEALNEFMANLIV